MDHVEKNAPYGELHGMFVVELFDKSGRREEIPAGAIYQGNGKYLVTSGHAIWNDRENLCLHFNSGAHPCKESWVSNHVHTLSLHGSHKSVWINPCIF